MCPEDKIAKNLLTPALKNTILKNYVGDIVTLNRGIL